MTFQNKIIKIAFGGRMKALDEMRDDGDVIQRSQFKRLIKLEGSVEYVAKLGIDQNSSYELFRSKVPVVMYEDVADTILKAIHSKDKLLCNDKIRWVAKSSGTTNDKSKYIPINHDYLWQCHYRGAKDVLVTMLHNYPKTKAYSGKSLTLGGSQTLMGEGSHVRVGDLSAILINNTPRIIDFLREPSREIALLSNFDQKVEEISKTCSNKDITSFAGVPSWNLVLMKRILEHTGKSNLLELWPNMSLFMHGGIAFEPYREQYKTLIPNDDMVYLETYNASEGFFALQDTKDHKDGMLLMLDYGIFYEFLPLSDFHDHNAVVPLWGVKKGVTYAMIISNISGLWRYMIGDTVEFTSVDPYRIKIVGRTKQFINAFGEELMVGNTDAALIEACRKTGARVNEYTVAPIFMDGSSKGAHEWVVEFDLEPDNVEQFADILDMELQLLNSDYKAKRTGDATMVRLKFNNVAKGTFYNWMCERGKSGGQNKVPRLSSDRNYVEHLLSADSFE